MPEKLVTIAKYNDYIKADMDRQKLEDFDIKAYVTGQNATNVYSISTIAHIELQVLQSQAEQARQILETKNNEDE